MGDWFGFLLQSLLFAYLGSVLFGALAGYTLARTGRLNLWLGVLVGGLIPVVGILGLAVAALVRYRGGSERPGSGWWVKSSAGRRPLFVLGILCIPLVFALTLGWFVLKIPGITLFRLGTADPVVGAIVAVSILSIIAAAACSLRAPSRIGALLVAWSGIWCLFIGAVALAVTRPMAEITASIAALNYTVGDLAAVVSGEQLPDLDSAPTLLRDIMERFSITPEALTDFDMAAALPTLGFVVGPGIYCILLFGVGAVAWSLWMFLLAAADSRRLGLGQPSENLPDRHTTFGDPATIGIQGGTTEAKPASENTGFWDNRG